MASLACALFFAHLVITTHASAIIQGEVKSRASMLTEEASTNLDESLYRKGPAPAPSPPQVAHIDFGGAQHGNDTHADGTMDLNRPEYIKSLVCEPTNDAENFNESACVECGGSNEAACWTPFGHLGNVHLGVAANSSQKVYAIRIWGHCADGEFHTWHVGLDSEYVPVWYLHGEHHEFKNGVIRVYVDGKLNASISESDVNGGWIRRVIPFVHDMEVKKSVQLTVTFTRVDKTKEGKADLFVSLKNPDSWQDTCLGVKTCLNKLGNLSAPDEKLRNSNRMQYDCINAPNDIARLAVSVSCPKWEACLRYPNPERKQNLGALLSAMLAGSESSLAEVPPSNESNCVNPLSADPESLECDCYEVMIGACGVGNTSCFKKHMCEGSLICEEWKAANCDGFASLIRKPLMRRASSLNSRSLNQLDTTVKAKCA